METVEIKKLTVAEEAILRVVPKRLKAPVEKVILGGRAEEIRLRIGKPVQVITQRGEHILNQYGNLLKSEADEMLQAICAYSVYAKSNELCSGFVTLDGGARVGISGKPLYADGCIKRLTAISSFNIRIAREVVGCAEKFMNHFFDGTTPLSAIIASPPGAGKTTLLRDCARCFSNGIRVPRPLKVAIADERNELSGCMDGIPTLDVGLRTDVMEGVPKAISIPLLIRSMSPDVIITDELGGDADMTAVAEATKHGVAVVTSVHSSHSSELRKRTWFCSALEDGHFAKVLFLRRTADRVNLIPMEI